MDINSISLANHKTYNLEEGRQARLATPKSEKREEPENKEGETLSSDVIAEFRGREIAVV